MLMQQTEWLNDGRVENNMTTQTRHGVFETNSSSTHSISIHASSDGVYDTLPVNDDGVVHLRGGSFGWEWNRYNDAETKANYCAIDAHSRYCEKDYNETPFSDEVIAARVQMLKEVIMEVTGAKDVVFDFSTEYNRSNWSYIDHQSYGTSFDAFESKEALKEFIFNPKSVLRTGNDNDDVPAGWRDESYVMDDKQYLYSREQVTETLVNLLAKVKKLNRNEVLDKLSTDDQWLIDYTDCYMADAIEMLNRRS
jgi:hypothetical protein